LTPGFYDGPEGGQLIMQHSVYREIPSHSNGKGNGGAATLVPIIAGQSIAKRKKGWTEWDRALSAAKWVKGLLLVLPTIKMAAVIFRVPVSLVVAAMKFLDSEEVEAEVEKAKAEAKAAKAEAGFRKFVAEVEAKTVANDGNGQVETPNYDELYAEYWESFPPPGCPGHL
jgi:hypothetical protein